MGNILAKVPEEGKPELAAQPRAVWDAAPPESGRAAATELIMRFGDQYPAAVACFTEDLDALGARDRSAADVGRERGTLEEKEDRVTQVAAFAGGSGLDPLDLLPNRPA